MWRRHALRNGLLLSVAIVLLLSVVLWFSPLRAILSPSTSPVSTTGTASPLHLTQYVNPFIGTTRGISEFGFAGDAGNTFPGASYPLGMVAWSPDTLSHSPGGYLYPDTMLKGFSLTHFSGRGCTVYQDISFMPYMGTVRVSPATHAHSYYARFSHSSEVAQPGYYKVHLEAPDVTTELSVTPHTGIGSFTYPASSSSTMLINVGASANGTTHASVNIDTSNRMITGSATSTVGCGSEHYTVYFAAAFDHTFTSWGTWAGRNVNQHATASASAQSGAFVTFGTNSIQVLHVQVGLSFVSIANARANLLAENANSHFDTVRTQADAAWNAKLNTIQVQGGTADERRVFYTSLYHVFLEPSIFSDVNGQYLGFDNMVHTVARGHLHFQNIPGWDAYRSTIRLLSIIDAPDASDLAQSLVDDATQGDGHIPRWVQANTDSHGMNGDGGSIMVAEAYAFGATNFDTTSALSAMLHGQANVREGLQDYLTLGYVANSTLKNATVVTQEYTNADFAIAQFARALGDQNDYATLLHRSGNWRNIFNPTSGYIQPRNRDGSWTANFDLASDKSFQEGNSAQYSWMESFDLKDLFASMGGNAAVVKRLNTFFTGLNVGQSQPYAFIGNEPCFEVPWEYDFAQAPAQTQNVIRRIQLRLFINSPDGLPGNDDGGAMSSWYIFSALGIYPEIPGIGGFVIGSPLFTSATIQLSGDHTLQITAPAAADNNEYVQSLQLNGHTTTQLWLPWSTVQNGATLNFALGSTPTTWGSAPTDTPPSYTP